MALDPHHGVVKTVIAAAPDPHARCPEGGGEVTIRYSARLASNGFQFASCPAVSPGTGGGSGGVGGGGGGEGVVGDDDDEGLTVTMGREMLVPGLERGVASMRVGERASFTVQPALAYGKDGSPDGNVPSNATVVYDVELVDAQPRPKTIWEMSDDVRGATCATLFVCLCLFAVLALPFPLLTIRSLRLCCHATGHVCMYVVGW